MTNSNDRNNNNSFMNMANEKIINRKHLEQQSKVEQHNPNSSEFKPQIRWPDLCAQLFLHVGAIYGLLFQFYKIKFLTLIWCKYFVYNSFIVTLIFVFCFIIAICYSEDCKFKNHSFAS